MCRHGVILLILGGILTLLAGKTIRADVTGDGIDDVIKLGMKMVTVQDGASNRLHTIVAGIDDLADISIDNFVEGTKVNEIALLRLPEKGYFTEVYGYRNKRFIKVSDALPGELSFDEAGRLFGNSIHAWDRNEAMIYWPILEHRGYLKPAEVKLFFDTSLVVEAYKTEEFPIDLQEKTFAMCVASTLDKDLIVFLVDEDGTLIKQTMIDPQTGFYGRVITGSAKTVTFNIDNSKSTRAKTVHLIVKQYKYP